MRDLITFDQMCALRELERARVKEGRGGLGSEVQALIRRLTDGRSKLKTDDPRIIQAKVLFDKGVGEALNLASFDDYLATIPEIPEKPPLEYLDRLILVDRRIHLVDACRLVNLKYDGDDNTFKPFDEKVSKKHGDVYWMWCQDGRRNRSRKPVNCRKQFSQHEVGMDAFEFVALFTQDETVIGTKENPHYVDLLGSVHDGDSSTIACGGLWDGEPRLRSIWGIFPSSYGGSATRWEC